MEENEHPVWAELRDMQAHERREFEARARGESSSTSFLRLNPGRGGAGPAPRSPAPPTQSSTPFQFPWSGGGGGGGGGGGRGWREHPANPARQGRAGAAGGRGGGTPAGLTGLFPSERYDDDRAGEWPPGGVAAGGARDSSKGGGGGGGRAGGMPGLLRGLGAAAPGRGFLLRGRREGGGGGVNDGLRGGGHDRGSDEDMGPAEFGLLMGEEGAGGGQEPLLADDWGAVENLDTFFSNMYKYYHSRGVLSIVSTGVAHLLILAFTVLFSTFLLSFVDWKALLSCRDEETCHPLSQYVTTRALRKPNLFHVLVWMYMVLFLVYWMWSLLSFGTSLRDAMDMHQLYTSRLKISPTDIHNIEWSEVVTRFLALQNSGIYRVAIYANDVTAHDIASRIMRKENYLIAMLNKGILKLSLPLPFLGSRGSGTLWATTGRQYLTKSLEWSVHFCVLNHMFSDKFTVRRAFLEDVRALRVRLVLVGLAHVVLLPFLLLFMVVYFFLQNAQEWHSSKSYLGPREWSPLARWTFREFNELQHFFERRMSGSYVHANAYLMRFPRPVLASLMRVIRFVSGAVVAVLLVMTFLEDSILLHVKVWDRNLLWYIGVFSAIYAFSRSVSPQASEASALQEESVEEVMLKVASHTHYMPEHWVGKAHTLGVRKELLTMFHYKAQLFVEELLSVLFAPVILCFSMPSCAQEIIDFVTDHTVDVEGVGSVCSYSLFDFGRYGDEDYAAPLPSSAVADAGREENGRRKPDTTEQGKMEKSFLNFRTHYPDWQPGTAGQEMIDRLAGFQLQCLRKDAEIVAASTAAAVAVAASAAAAAPVGQGGSHWGQSTGVPRGSHAYGQHPAGPQPGPRGEAGGDATAQGTRAGKLDHREDSTHGGEGHGSVQSGMGDNVRMTRAEEGSGNDDGGGGGAKGGPFAAEDDDERSDRPSPMFPLLSPPRAEPGNVGAAGGGGGGRLSPSVGLTPSTVQLGLLNSVSPSMLLGPGAGAWLGATGGVGGGTGGFGMSAAAPSFVQTSQLAPFLLSQMGPHGSFGVGTPSMFGRGTQGAPAASGPLGQGQEKNFYWLERFYAAHRSSTGLSSASGDAGPRASTTSAGLSHGGGAFGSKFGVRHDRGGGGGAPPRGHGRSSVGGSAVMPRGDGAAGGSVSSGGTGLRGGVETEGGREGVGHVEEDGEGYAMEMTSQQQQQQQQQHQHQQQQQQHRPDGLA